MEWPPRGRVLRDRGQRGHRDDLLEPRSSIPRVAVEAVTPGARHPAGLVFKALEPIDFRHVMSVYPETMPAEDFQALFDRCSNWGRWGADDERGTLNLITPDVRVRAAGLVQDGVTVSCAHPVNTVSDIENTNPALHFMLRAGDVADGKTVTSTADHLAVSPHGLSHSHLDALCHFFWQGKTYNGRPVSLVTSTGARANAITIGQDGIVSRGILLDVPRALGKGWLEPDHAITVADLEEAERACGVTVSSGDALLVRTGRQVRRSTVGAWDGRGALAGLHHTAAPWLKERGVALLGCDGVSDVRAQPFTETTQPIHVLTLVAMGMQLLDNQNLDDLAAVCVARSRWAFMLVVAPLKLSGGTASMVNPIAIF
jgi:kynurenine formamidase